MAADIVLVLAWRPGRPTCQPNNALATAEGERTTGDAGAAVEDQSRRTGAIAERQRVAVKRNADTILHAQRIGLQAAGDCAAGDAGALLDGVCTGRRQDIGAVAGGGDEAVRAIGRKAVWIRRGLSGKGAIARCRVVNDDPRRDDAVGNLVGRTGAARSIEHIFAAGGALTAWRPDCRSMSSAAKPMCRPDRG